MSYIWENPNWPDFFYNEQIVSLHLAALNSKIEDTDKLFKILDSATQKDIYHSSLTAESINSSSIEGITLHADTVANSLAEKLDISCKVDSKTDIYSENVSEVIWDAVNNTDKPITFERLFSWQTLLVKEEPMLSKGITVGDFRKGFVGVYSGYLGKEKLEYAAPPAESLFKEMNCLIKWINSRNEQSDLIKSAICSLWFVAIHPFDDGNGRISRALADYIISQKIQFHYFSVSKAIEKVKSQYYEQLNLVTGQSDSLDLTDWICWYLGVIKNAVNDSYLTFIQTVRLTRIMNSPETQHLNSRQKDIIYRLSSDTFYGNLTNEKYAKIEKCSSATATRDLTELVEDKFLYKSQSGGRSTSYSLNENLFTD